MEKIKYLLSILLIGILFCIMPVMAYTVETSSSNSNVSNFPPDNAFGRLWSNLFIFSSVNANLGCSATPSSTKIWSSADVMIIPIFPYIIPRDNIKTVKVSSGEAVLVKWYRGSDNTGQPMGQAYLEYGQTNSYKMECDASAYWNKKCYYEVFDCTKTQAIPTGQTTTQTTTPKPGIVDPAIEAQLYGFSFGDINGKPITIAADPGSEVDVTVYVKSTKDWTLFLDNQNLYIEVGIVPADVANQWNINQASGIFATLKMGDTANSNIFSECCDIQENIQGGQKVGWSSLSHEDMKITAKVNVPSPSTQDMCGYGVNFYNSNTTNYVVYVSLKNGCSKDGYNVGRYLAKDLQVNTGATTVNPSGAGLEGAKCSENYECASGVCQGTLIAGKKCIGGISGTNVSLIEMKKIALTKDEISIAPTTQLFASACYSPNECLPKEGYDITCNSLPSLRTDGTLPQATTDSLMDIGKRTVVGAATGGAIGSGLVLVACGVGAGVVLLDPTKLSVAALGLVLPACAGAASAAFGIGAAAGGAIAYKAGSNDPLEKAFDTKDVASVGICTAVPVKTNTGLDKITGWAALFDINGDGVKDGTDGLIIIIGAIVILWFLNGFIGRPR